MRFALHAADDRQGKDLHAFIGEIPAVADGDESNEQIVDVLPPPGADGLLATKDGRQYRVSDPAMLVERLNAQMPEVRVDFDHQTERQSHTYRGSTAAEGWVSQFRVAANGAIQAVMALSAYALHRVRSREYRYLSPAMWYGKDGEITGFSSLALVNNPNMPLPAINDDAGATAEDLEARETQLQAREEAADKLMMNAAERVVDTAINEKRLPPAQKEFCLNAIKAHTGGVEQGIEAFAKAFPAEAETPALNQLDRRVGPRGVPAGTGSAAGTEFATPLGRTMVDQDQLAMHSQVTEHARKQGISYREAVLQLGALQ